MWETTEFQTPSGPALKEFLPSFGVFALRVGLIINQLSMDLAISWRMKRPVYAPVTASSGPSRNRCRNRSHSPTATRTHRTPSDGRVIRPREAKLFTRKHPRLSTVTAACGETFYAVEYRVRMKRSDRVRRSLLRGFRPAAKAIHQFQNLFADVEDLLAGFTDHLVRQEIFRRDGFQARLRLV